MVSVCKSSKYFYNNKIISHFCTKYIVIKGVIVKNVKKFGLQIIFSYFCSRIQKFYYESNKNSQRETGIY